MNPKLFFVFAVGVALSVLAVACGRERLDAELQGLQQGLSAADAGLEDDGPVQLKQHVDNPSN